MDERPVTGEQVEQIIARALELERDGPMLDQADLREIAREINISSAALEQATQEVLAGADRSAPPAKPRGRLSAAIEGVASVTGGLFAGGLMGTGFPPLAVTALFLMGIGLASRRDRSTIARLFAQWVTMAGSFALMAGLLGQAIPTVSLAALFAGGGVITGAIAWLKGQREPASSESDPSLLRHGPAAFT